MAEHFDNLYNFRTQWNTSRSTQSITQVGFIPCQLKPVTCHPAPLRVSPLTHAVTGLQQPQKGVQGGCQV